MRRGVGTRAALGAAAIVAVVVTVFAGGRAARAADPPADEAGRLYEEAMTAYREFRYEEAITAFRRAFELTHEPILLFNVAKSIEQLDRVTEAIAAYQEYLDVAGPGVENRAAVEGRIAFLTERRAETMKLLRVESEPPGARVFLGDGTEPVGETPIERWVAFGEQRVRVLLAGHVPQDRTETVTRTSPGTVSFTLVATTAPGRVELRGIPAGARVELDTQLLGVAPIVEPALVAPGDHRVRIVRGGRPAVEEPFVVVPGETSVVDLAPALATADGGAADVAVHGGADGRGFEVPWYGWTTIGLTAAGLGAGIAGIVLAKQKADDAQAVSRADGDPGRWQALVDERDTNLIVGYVGFGVAAASAIGTGLILWLHNTRDDEAPAPPPVTLAPLGPGVPGVVVQGQF